MIKIVKEHIRFHYLLKEIQLCTLILLELNVFPQEVLNKIGDKSITHNIFRIEGNESIMCEYMLAGKTLLDYTNLFSPNYYKKNDKII